jgi:hypothetical protein
MSLTNTGGITYMGLESSVGGVVFAGSTAYASVFGSGGATPAQFLTNGTVRVTILPTSGNVGIRTLTPGGSSTAGTGVLSLGNGTPPVGGVANQFSMYSADFVAGNAIPYFLTENGTVIGLNQDLTTASSPTFAGLTLGTGPLIQALDAAHYFGAVSTAGSWRIIRESNDLVFDRYESAAWVTKFRITAVIP